jgi:dienelactone hydrolase
MTQRLLSVPVGDERVPVLLSLPERGRGPLVLAGHGLGVDKRSPFPLSLASDLASLGIAVASVDAPGHGQRAEPGADGASVAAGWRDYWGRYGASRIAGELSAVVDALAATGEIDVSRVGYWGLSLATQYGLGWLAHERRVRAAVLGLFGLPEPGLRLHAYAPRVRTQVLFIAQEDDEIHPFGRAQALFEIIGSHEKRFLASPGRHTEVPQSAWDAGYEWIAARLSAGAA